MRSSGFAASRAPRHADRRAPGGGPADRSVDRSPASSIKIPSRATPAGRIANGTSCSPATGRSATSAFPAFTDAEPGEKGTAADFRAALEQLRKEKIRGLVLDLRDNGGGSLPAAVDICDMLVPQGEIVTTRGRDGQILQPIRASGKAPFTDFPMAVLVNRDSASASEIVAACLQDHDRAIVVGERSYGKGTVQEVVDLGHTFGAMKLTIATYWRPSGQNINRPKEDANNDAKNAAWGVSPNEGYEVPIDDKERDRLLHWQQEHELAALSGEKARPATKCRTACC